VVFQAKRVPRSVAEAFAAQLPEPDSYEALMEPRRAFGWVQGPGHATQHVMFQRVRCKTFHAEYGDEQGWRWELMGEVVPDEHSEQQDDGN